MKGINPKYPVYIKTGIERSGGYSIYLRLMKIYDLVRLKKREEQLIREAEAHNAKALAKMGIKLPPR